MVGKKRKTPEKGKTYAGKYVFLRFRKAGEKKLLVLKGKSA
jgi:hypothetical protein